ncbi:MAG: pilin [Patescibacteria group bacterium]
MLRQILRKKSALALLASTAIAFVPLAAAAIAFPDPFAGRSVQVIIGDAIRVVLGITGSIALLMFLYGGFTWMTAGGSPDKVEKAKNTLTWAGLGLAVIFSSYVIVNFVIGGLQQGAPAAGGGTTTCNCVCSDVSDSPATDLNMCRELSANPTSCACE